MPQPMPPQSNTPALDPKVQELMVQLQEMGLIGGSDKPDNMKVGGTVYSINPQGQAQVVLDPATGQPLHEDKPDSSPTTVHVPGKGTLQYDSTNKSWSMVPGSEETVDAPKSATYQLADGRVGIIKFDANGNPYGQALGGDNPATGQNPPAVVSPGQGVRGPDGSYTVPVPANAPSQTPEQADLTRAQTGLVTAQTAAVQTPAQAQAQRLQEIQATYQAQTDAALKLVKDKIAAGIELTEADKIQAEADVQAAAAQRDSDLRKAEAEATFTREQPNKDRAFGIQDTQNQISQENAQTNAAQVENTRVNNERQNQLQRDTQAVGVLKDQATAGQANIESLVKSGIAPSKGSIAMLRNPLEAAFHIMQSQVQDGSLHPNNLPTPMAPRPAGMSDPSMMAPRPAPTVGMG